MPWQDKIIEACERIDHLGGIGSGPRNNDYLSSTKKEIFAQAQIPGTISMCEGGGDNPVGLLIETQNGWLVRVTLTRGEARALADLLNSC
jgi:hypothetical protein